LATSRPQNPDAHFDVACPGCGRSYPMPSHAAGRQGTCKKCGTRFAIAAPTAAAPAAEMSGPPDTGGPSSRVARTRELLQLLGDSIVFPKQRITLGHKLAGFFVACLMLLLPILYVAFVVAIAGLTWWHARYDYIWVKGAAGHASIVAGALYVGLSIGGLLWTLSLIRPLFTRIRPPDDGARLSRRDEPALFAFVERLADKVGCPRPDVIRLNLDANASAYYETSFFGLRRRAFTLTLGLPLVSGLTLCQLAGIIAHELGHFGQRRSGFLDRFIRRVNLWLALAVSRPTLLDELIASLGASGHYLMLLVGLVLKLLVLLGRYALWCLMQVGLIASASLLQRMEFDADCYEVGVVGSAEFEATCRRMVELIVARDLALQYAFGSTDCRLLPSDLVAFISELADREPKVKKRARKLIESEEPSWLATHPPIRERIVRAQRLNLPGLLKSAAAGSTLFESLELRSRAVTALLYAHHYGGKVTPDTIRSAHEIVELYLGRETAGGFQLPAGAR
jgi:Zn-dependent protease with chaperone function